MSEMYYLEASAKIRYSAAMSSAARARLASQSSNAERAHTGQLLRRRVTDFLRRGLPRPGQGRVQAALHH